MASTLVFGFIAVIIIVALTSWFGVVYKSSRELFYKEQAFHIAEAGIEYYRWHLAHDSTDYYDGTENSAGPHVHDFKDKKGDVIGNFTLNIIAPSTTTSVVSVESTGVVLGHESSARKIKVKFGKPSFAKFAFVSDSDMRFGAGTEVFGAIHSNGGIRFDGLAHNIVTSALSVYDDPDHSGGNEYGVHTHLSPTDPLPPANLADRFDVFQSGREFPVPAVDFVGMISDLAEMKVLAEENGKYFAGSGNLGYKVVLKTNDTFDLYKVTRLKSVPKSSCQNSLNQSGWGTWSVDNTVLVGNYNFPNNGLIFLEDDVWVEGKINTAKLAVVAGKFPDSLSTRKSITINNDLTYTNYGGEDVLALIAQKDINTGLFSDNDLRIDAALIAQNGRAGRYYYPSGCTPNHTRSTLTLYGMLATKNRYGYAYTDGTGYATRNIIYDASLLYNPPPYFPLTSDQYEVVSWEEVR